VIAVGVFWIASTFALGHVSPQQLSTTLATGYPSIATGLQQLPAILDRIDHLVTAVGANIENFGLADVVQPAVQAAVLVLAGAGIALAGGRRRSAIVGLGRVPAAELASV
jgi:hypothetical protein